MYINSNSKSSGSSGNFVVPIRSNPIDVSSKYTTYIAVTSATIPITYFPVRTGNNIFVWSEATGGDVTTTITPGFYTGSTFATIIGTKMTEQSPNALTYVVDYLPDLGKIQINVPSGTLTLKMSSAASTASSIMGFNDEDVADTDEIVSPNPISIGGPKTIHIRMNAIIGNMYNTYEASLSNVLAVVPVVGTRFSTMVFQPLFITPCIVTSQLSEINIILTDEYSNVLDFNGVNVDIELSVFRRQPAFV